MQTYKLSIHDREKTGRGSNRRLREDGRIPASLYGQGKARSISVGMVDFRVLNREIGGSAAVIELHDDKGGVALSLVQEVQKDAVKGSINHIDFQEIERGHSFVTHIPVVLKGEANALGVKNEGGMIDHKAHTVEIRCRPSKLPEHVEVDVSHLNVGDAVHIRELPVLEDVEYLGNGDQVIVSCQPPTVSVASTAETEKVEADSVPATKVSKAEGDEA